MESRPLYLIVVTLLLLPLTSASVAAVNCEGGFVEESDYASSSNQLHVFTCNFEGDVGFCDYSVQASIEACGVDRGSYTITKTDGITSESSDSCETPFHTGGSCGLTVNWQGFVGQHGGGSISNGEYMVLSSEFEFFRDKACSRSASPSVKNHVILVNYRKCCPEGYEYVSGECKVKISKVSKACNDGEDNDNDGFVDENDPGCWSGAGCSYNPVDNSEEHTEHGPVSFDDVDVHKREAVYYQELDSGKKCVTRGLKGPRTDNCVPPGEKAGSVEEWYLVTSETPPSADSGSKNCGAGERCFDGTGVCSVCDRPRYNDGDRIFGKGGYNEKTSITDGEGNTVKTDQCEDADTLREYYVEDTDDDPCPDDRSFELVTCEDGCSDGACQGVTYSGCTYRVCTDPPTFEPYGFSDCPLDYSCSGSKSISGCPDDGYCNADWSCANVGSESCSSDSDCASGFRCSDGRCVGCMGCVPADEEEICTATDGTNPNCCYDVKGEDHEACKDSGECYAHCDDGVLNYGETCVDGGGTCKGPYECYDGIRQCDEGMVENKTGDIVDACEVGLAEDCTDCGKVCKSGNETNPGFQFFYRSNELSVLPNCKDGIDNDHDCLVDCEDPDCPQDNCGMMFCQGLNCMELTIDKKTISTKPGENVTFHVSVSNTGSRNPVNVTMYAENWDHEYWFDAVSGECDDCKLESTRDGKRNITMETKDTETMNATLTFHVPEGTEPGSYGVKVGVEGA